MSCCSAVDLLLQCSNNLTWRGYYILNNKSSCRQYITQDFPVSLSVLPCGAAVAQLRNNRSGARKRRCTKRCGAVSFARAEVCGTWHRAMRVASVMTSGGASLKHWTSACRQRGAVRAGSRCRVAREDHRGIRCRSARFLCGTAGRRSQGPLREDAGATVGRGANFELPASRAMLAR